MAANFFKPKQSIQRMPQDMMIGELLVKAQIISQKQLDECIRLAGNKRLHLGQMLMMSGYITPRDLQAAVDAQTMLRDKLVDIDFAIKCLKIAYKQGYTFGEVVSDQQAIEQQADANRAWTVGHLLLESELATQSQLDAAYQRSNATGIQVGRILILNGVISELILSRALDLMVKVRDEVCSRDEAVEAMRVAAGISPGSPLTQNLLLPPASKRPRLGQLMLSAGIMSETDVMNAVELGLAYNMLIGQVMVEQGYVSGHLVEAALELQHYIEDGQVDAERAGEVLQKVYNGAGSVSDLVTSLQPILKMSGTVDGQPRLTFEKLLVLSRVVSQEQIGEAFDICRQTPEALAKILCLTGFIEGNVHDAVLRCHELLEQGRLTQDDALVALDYCFNKGSDGQIGFDDALTELGWSDTSLSASEHAQLALDQSWDPERTADEMPVLVVNEGAAESVPGFNLLEHFGLQKDEEAEAAPAAKAAQEETTSENEPTEADEESWVLPEDSGEGPSLKSMGVTTSDTPALTVADKVMDEPLPPAEVKRPSTSNTRLSSILDRLSEDGEEESQEEAVSSNGSPEKSDNGQGAPALDAKKVVEPPPPPKSAALGPLGRVRPDRDALRQQEMTIAPQRLKIEESALLSKKEEDAPAEPEADKKAAVGAAMYRLAESYFEQGDFTEAQKIYEKILAIRQAELGSQHLDLVDDLNKLAEVLWVQGNFRQAEPFVRRAVTILESTQPVDALRLAEGLRILAGLYFQQGKFDLGRPLLENALLLKKQTLGEDHRDVGNLLREYAKLLKKMGHAQEAEKIYLQAKKILSSEG